VGASHVVVVCSVSFATAFGYFSLATQLLLFRKNHARLACSVVNALTTAHCRYRLLRISDRGKPCPYGFYQIKLYAEPSLPLTRKVARRRRDGRRESNKYQIFVISPSVIFQKKNDCSLVRGSLYRTAARAVHTVEINYNQIIRKCYSTYTIKLD